jgi:hypothetical protein
MVDVSKAGKGKGTWDLEVSREEVSVGLVEEEPAELLFGVEGEALDAARGATATRAPMAMAVTNRAANRNPCMNTSVPEGTVGENGSHRKIKLGCPKALALTQRRAILFVV